MNDRYAVALSGGVDSSTTAAMLLNEGHEVFGVTMLLQSTGCQMVIDKASKVAQQLGIKHYVFDAINEFKKEVIDYFINSYMTGTTPNPCAICNKKIKLNKLLSFAQEKGADYLATGHYANIECINNDVFLKESKNSLKDQSYFLSLTSREHLKYIKTPLCNITHKQETRNLAKSFGLNNFHEKDSQDICFIRNGDYISFIRDNIEDKKLLNKCGNIILQSNGNCIAQHKGLVNYTIGQRRGLGIPNNEPLYVTNINYSNNTLTVGIKRDLLVKTFQVNQFNWLLDINDNKFECHVRIRAGHSKYKSLVEIISNDVVNVHLLENNTVAVCPGQVCALYNKDNVVIGAGIITLQECNNSYTTT
ncbi:MAG: tRNA 2-thiouridine(34) synthase MnmA [Alphaproteobacteria bacterium]|nr:tRNA 2-thiouridine(34) synthase MnmA [Alphaproteobacteria bacterium]